MSYPDRQGKRIRESTFTQDWQEANRKLRGRLLARDDRVLEIVKKGEQLEFTQWGDFFLENYSKPPLRAGKTHAANLRVAKHLKNAFRSRKLADLSADEIEWYLRKRLRDRVRIKTVAGQCVRQSPKRCRLQLPRLGGRARLLTARQAVDHDMSCHTGRSRVRRVRSICDTPLAR